MLYSCCKAVLDYNSRTKHKQPELKDNISGYDKIFYTAIGKNTSSYCNLRTRLTLFKLCIIFKKIEDIDFF